MRNFNAFTGKPMLKFNLYDQKIDFAAIKDACREKGTHTHYAKDEHFMQQGYVGKYLGVVESGYFKYVTLTSSGEEAVVGFAFEGEIVADYYNSFNDLPSEISIKAGSDAEVSQIRTAEARELFYSVYHDCLSSINGALFSEIYTLISSCTERHLPSVTLI